MLHYNGVNKWKGQPQSHHKKEHLEEALPKPSFHQQVNSSWATTNFSATAMKSTSQNPNTEPHQKKTTASKKNLTNTHAHRYQMESSLSTTPNRIQRFTNRVPKRKTNSREQLTAVQSRTNRLQLNADTTYHDTRRYHHIIKSSNAETESSSQDLASKKRMHQVSFLSRRFPTI
jgi:hypothetical protein